MQVWIWKISHSKYLHVRLINFIRVSSFILRFTKFTFDTSCWLPGNRYIEISSFPDCNILGNEYGGKYQRDKLLFSLWRTSFSRWSNRRKWKTRLPEFTLSYEYVMARRKKKEKEKEHPDSRFVKLNSWVWYNEITR